MSKTAEMVAKQWKDGSPPAYAELMTTSNFSFLRAGSHPQELIAAAMSLGLSGLGLCDRNSFAGVVRAYSTLCDMKPDYPDFRYVVGTRLCFADGSPDIIAYPTDRASYGRLCKLLTIGNERGKKGDCQLVFEDLLGFCEGQLFIVHLDETAANAGLARIAQLLEIAPDRVWLAAACTFKGNDRARLNWLSQIGGQFRIPLLAVNDVLYHEPGRRILHDVVTCIRQHMTLWDAGRLLQQNAERHLKSAPEMARLFAEHPDAIFQTQIVLGKIQFSLDQLKYNYPEETVGNGETAQQTLDRLTWAGAATRYPKGVPEKLKPGIRAELSLIAELKYAPYFLTVHDIVRHARDNLEILCQGRGSAANSMVCYCLGITDVDPITGNLVFGRFLSTERNEPPDIDVDFEHERREEIIQYIYGKYSRERTGLTATVISYRSKSAIREVCRVFGISDDTIAALNQLHWGWSSNFSNDTVREIGLDPNEPTLNMALEVARALRGFPRHLSQHVGGFVITRDALDHLVPIGRTAMEGRTIVEWDKNDIVTLGILKVDILALGMLTCLRRAFDLLHAHYGKDVTIAQLMAEEADPVVKARVYAMTHRADTIGVFQIESRAQMSMLPRLKPVEFYDLVIEVAIVRPGPIQGGMVHPYLQRRMQNEAVDYPSVELEDVLSRTLGIPLFQEQAMQIAVKGAGFSPGKADQLRRAMATWKSTGKVKEFRQEFIAGMILNGYDEDYADRCFSQIEGFGEYGFPESHAASFALLVYASCWLKCHYPDVFATALLNSQPMGFYAPSQIIRDAIEHGVDVRPVDINLSEIEHSLQAPAHDEPVRMAGDHVWSQHAEMADDIWSDKALRLGLKSIAGLSTQSRERIIACRGSGYDSVRDLWLRTGLGPAVLEKLAYADAFSQTLGLSRRDALWAVRGLIGTHGADSLPLFAAAGAVATERETGADLPPMPPGEEVIHDYRSLSFSLKGHPVGFLRPALTKRRIVRANELPDVTPGRSIEVAGLVLVRQRPGTAKGVIFATLEDETGVANVVIWSKVFEANRKTILGARMLAVRGQLQREGLVIHIIAKTLTDMTPMLLDLAAGHDIGDTVVARGDEAKSGPPPGRDRQVQLQVEAARRAAYAAMPGGGNFH